MKPLSKWAARILDLFRWFQKTTGRIFPKQSTIAKWLGCCVRTVKRAIADLVEDELLFVECRYKRSNKYSLERPASPQMAFDFGVDKPVELSRLVPVNVPAECKPDGRVFQRRQSFTPLVIFRNVYKRFARQIKAKAQPKTLFEKLQELGLA